MQQQSLGFQNVQPKDTIRGAGEIFCREKVPYFRLVAFFSDPFCLAAAAAAAYAFRGGEERKRSQKDFQKDVVAKQEEPSSTTTTLMFHARLLVQKMLHTSTSSIVYQYNCSQLPSSLNYACSQHTRAKCDPKGP